MRVISLLLLLIAPLVAEAHRFAPSALDVRALTNGEGRNRVDKPCAPTHQQQQARNEKQMVSTNRNVLSAQPQIMQCRRQPRPLRGHRKAWAIGRQYFLKKDIRVRPHGHHCR